MGFLSLSSSSSRAISLASRAMYILLASSAARADALREGLMFCSSVKSISSTGSFEIGECAITTGSGDDSIMFERDDDVVGGVLVEFMKAASGAILLVKADEAVAAANADGA